MPHLVLTVRRQGAEGEAAGEHDPLVPGHHMSLYTMCTDPWSPEGTPGARVCRLDDAGGPPSAHWPDWSVQDPEHHVMVS